MGLEKPTVETLFNEVRAARVVLPDFQRSFVWNADQIRELLVSILGKFYIGTFLYMDMIANDSIFALRLVEGVEKISPGAKMAPLVTVILDGQQRTTSLFYALAGPDLPLAGRKAGARFFFNIPAILTANWDKAVTYVSANNAKELEKLRSSPHEIETTRILVPTDVAQSLQSGPYAGKASWDVVKILNDFLQYSFNYVELAKGTPLERVVETFQRINEHIGEPLSVKDLLVARLYKHGLRFRDYLADYRDEVFSEVDPEFVLKVMALKRHGGIRRHAILDLEPENFAVDWQEAKNAVGRAYQRMLDTSKGYGALAWKQVPSKQLVVILSALLWRASAEGREDGATFKKIDRWYWVSVFLNRYDAAVNTVIESDWKETSKWIFEGGTAPDFIAGFDADKVDLDVTSSNHAIYRGVLSLVVLAGAHDFKTNQPPNFAADRAQDDHIFPKSQYKNNLVLNRTIITTNQAKGDRIPSAYFSSLITLNGREMVEETLATHLIPREALDLLLSDNLTEFLRLRRASVLAAIKDRVAS